MVCCLSPDKAGLQVGDVESSGKLPDIVSVPTCVCLNEYCTVCLNEHCTVCLNEHCTVCLNEHCTVSILFVCTLYCSVLYESCTVLCELCTIL